MTSVEIELRERGWRVAFTPVHRLARAVGHEWGQVPPDDYAGLARLPWTVRAAEIEAVYCSRVDEDCPRGRTSPDDFYFPPPRGNYEEARATVRIGRLRVDFRDGLAEAFLETPGGGEVGLWSIRPGIHPAVIAALAWCEGVARGYRSHTAASIGFAAPRAGVCEDEVYRWVDLIDRDGLTRALATAGVDV